MGDSKPGRTNQSLAHSIFRCERRRCPRLTSFAAGPAESLLTGVGDAISRLRPESELGRLSGFFFGVYYALIASSILLLALHVVGLVYRLADQRIETWQARLRAGVAAGKTNPRFHSSRVLRFSVRALRDLLATALVLFYFFYGFTNFPRTEIFTNAPRKMLAPPLREAA